MAAEVASGTDGSDSQACLKDGMDALNTWIQSSSAGKGGLVVLDATGGWMVVDVSDSDNAFGIRCRLGLNVASNVLGL